MVYDHHYLCWYHRNLGHRQQVYCCPYLCIYFDYGVLLVHQEEAVKLGVQGRPEVLQDGEYNHKRSILHGDLPLSAPVYPPHPLPLA